MKLNPDDPRLSAYLLGELPPDEAAEVERAVAANPALKVALDDLARVQRFLAGTLGEGEGRLHGWQREAVRREVANVDAAGKVVELPSRRRSWRPVLALAAAVAFLAGGVWVMLQIPVGNEEGVAGGGSGGNLPPDWSDPQVEIALLPLPGPVDGGGVETGVAAGGGTTELVEAQELALRDDPGGFLERIGRTLEAVSLPPKERLPVWPERAVVRAAETPSISLPLIAGDLSFGWIREALAERGELPPKGAVRIEEMLNHFDYGFGDSKKLLGLCLTMESVRCPWDRDSILNFVWLLNGGQEARRVKARLDCDPAGIDRYRLLGFDRARCAAPTGDLAGILLPGGHRLGLAVQAWPVVTMDGSAMSVELSDDSADSAGPTRFRAFRAEEWQEASADLRHATLMAGFGLWLRDSKISVPEIDQLAELAAAEIERLGDDVPERTAALELIEVARLIGK